MQSKPSIKPSKVLHPVAPTSKKAETSQQPQPLDLKVLGQVGGGKGLPFRNW
jgi:hypothetical protein